MATINIKDIFNIDASIWNAATADIWNSTVIVKLKMKKKNK